jgi:homoserine dehydrogenase
MVQKEPHEGQEFVDIVILTHMSLEKNVNAAMVKIEALAAISEPVARIRLEELAK